MNKKLVKPIIFKRGIRNLIDYLVQGEGVFDRGEWKVEVKAVSLTIDKADINTFNKIVRKLDIFGVDYYEASRSFDLERKLFDRRMNKILDNIKNNEKF